MWSLLLLRWRVGLTLGAAGFIAAAMEAAGIGPTSADGFLAKVGLFISPLGLTAILGVSLGAWRSAWTLPCKLGLRLWFPDLNGVWAGELQSSRSREHADTLSYLRLRIVQSWGKIAVFSDGKDGSSASIPILCQPSRYHGQPCLYVIYEGRSNTLSETDSERFLGAERIVFHAETDSLIGEYMTDRAWMRGNNTAGCFELYWTKNEPRVLPLTFKKI